MNYHLKLVALLKLILASFRLDFVHLDSTSVENNSLIILLSFFAINFIF